MSINMIKRLCIGLLLLSSCSTTPVTVTGQLMPDYPASLHSEKDKYYLDVWFCSEDINLAGAIANTKYSAIARSKIREKAERECRKAQVSEDNRSYSIQNLPPGRYEIAAITDIRRSPALAVPNY